MNPQLQPQIEPGDALHYFDPKSISDWGVAVKTFTRISHIEIYRGDGKSCASRIGKGVDIYPVRMDGLVCVRRPESILDFDTGWEWFDKVAKGQRYDWLGLCCYTLAVKQGAKDRMYCSEFALRQYRQMGIEPVNPEWDADRTPPAMFYWINSFFTVWEKEYVKV